MKHTHPASPIGRSVHCEPSKTTTKACCGATSSPHRGASSVMLVVAVWNSPMVAAVATPVPVGAAVARRRRGTGEAAPSNRMPATGADPRRLRRDEASASPNASATLAPLVEVGRVPWFASCAEAGVGEEGETSHTHNRSGWNQRLTSTSTCSAVQLSGSCCAVTCTLARVGCTRAPAAQAATEIMSRTSKEMDLWRLWRG